MLYDSDDSLDQFSSDNQPLLKMSRSNDDPFYTIRDEVKAQSDQIKVRHEKFQDLVRNVDTSSNTEFIELRKGLVKDVRVVDRKLKGLKEAVEVVEKNRTKFPHIRDPELAARKQFVDSVQVVINDVKVGLEAPAVRRKMENDTMKAQRSNFEISSNNNPMNGNGTSSSGGVGNGNSGSMSRSNAVGGGNNNKQQQPNYNAALESENDRFIKDSRQQQKLMIRQQDQNLAHLEKAVDSVGVMAKDIHQELKEQDKLLDALGNEIDDNKSRLDTVMTSLNKLLKSKDGCQMYTIIILTIVLIILIAVVIWG